MAKRRHQEVQTESSKTAVAIMAVGGLAVAALVVWALTRTVQPAPTTTSAPVIAEQPATMPATGTASNPTLPPLDTAATPPGTPNQTSTYTPNPPTADENAAVTRISVADLKARLDAKQITLVDVRQDTAFMTGHIPGAMNIPMATVEGQIASLPKDKPIVTYCT
jgi:Rhodanese-like domain